MTTNPTGTFREIIHQYNFILDMVYSEYLVDDRYINEENIDCFNRKNSLRIGWIYANKK